MQREPVYFFKNKFKLNELNNLLRIQIFVAVVGMYSDTVAMTTDKDSIMVKANALLSPVSIGNMKTNGAMVDRMMTGSMRFMR